MTHYKKIETFTNELLSIIKNKVEKDGQIDLRNKEIYVKLNLLTCYDEKVISIMADPYDEIIIETENSIYMLVSDLKLCDIAQIADAI